ncbi:hypothetical protein [Chryseobacterium sp. CT-SW4]|uniref:hypothetical protein n=1 Tax=Chryseobacterium sp. SW-1 TaxID=3157343 RepID=UPI003B0291E9
MSNQTPVAYRYYPRLSSVVTENDIPEILGFIRDGVINLLDKIYFKDLQYSKSPKGDSAFYSLSIVSKRIDIEIPGTEIFLVLNPDIQGNDSNISAFPITIEYQWKILAYLRFFSLGNFSFDPQQIFELALRVLNVTEEQAIAHFVNTFVEPTGQNITPLVQFVQDVNTNENLGLTIPTNATTVTDVVKDIFAKTGGKYASLVAFGVYLLTNDLQDTATKVKTYFRSLVPQDIDEFIKEVIIPKFKATLLLSAAVEFPRHILTPVYPYNDPNNALEPIPDDGNGNPKVSLSFAEALFYADTERGFGYNMDVVLSTNHPAQIGNTGFVIDIHNLKIDLSKKENIAEADADGRPKEFMGVYMEYTEIFLPKKWFKKNDGQTLGISANHLLIGTGGLSGNIAIRATYKTKVENNITVVTSYFQDYFGLDYPVNVKSLSDTTFTTVNDHAGLVAFINSLGSPSQLKFEYPLGLTTIAGDYREFKDEKEYNTFLSGLVFDENQFLWFDLGKDPEKAWAIGFNHFDIDFYQGQVVHSSLRAALKIRKFKAYDGEDLLIDIKGEWETRENFKLSAAFLPFGLPMNLFNILTFYLQNIEIGKKDDNFYIEADTKITFPEDSFGEKLLGKEGIDLPAIRYYANGKFELAGGNSIIPTNLTLNIGPISMGVSAIHMGTIQRNYKGVIRSYNYIGFDGGINVNPLGLDVRGSGVKFYYTNDEDEIAAQNGISKDDPNYDEIVRGYRDSYFHISTLEVDLVIPGTASASSAIAIIKGSLTIPEPGVSSEYKGKVSLQLPQLNISGSVDMAFDPKYPGFFLDANVELPFVIPLGSFGIFGFRGLLGYRYIADKRALGMENDTWYDYYVAPKRGINMDKFVGPQFTKDYSFPFSLGAGASLATLDGRLASLRAMVLLSVPSMFAIDAGLTILSERLGLTEDDARMPPFYAFVIIGDNSLELGAGGEFQLNKNNGSFIDIKAEIQMGFFFKNQKPWYVNFGTKEKPITAKLFKDTIGFKAQAYLMISAKGIETGAKVDFTLNLIILKVFAAIEVGGHVSFERPQVGGYIYVAGGAEINLFIVKVSLFVSIYFRVELVVPFLILAEFKFELKVKVLFVKIKLKINLSIKFEKSKQVDTTPVAPITYVSDDPSIDYPKEERLDNAVKGVNMLTNEEFSLKDAIQVNQMPTIAEVESKNIVVPLDTYIDIKIEKGLIPTSSADEKIGGHTSGASGYMDLIPPEKNQPGGHVIRQVKHVYSIEDIEIKIADKEKQNWQDYNPYRAVLTQEEADQIPNIDKFKIGFWQKTNEKYEAIRILASTPFTFLDAGQPGWFIPEQYGITASSLFCTRQEMTWHFSNVLNEAVGTIYHQPAMYPSEYINGAYYSILGAVTDNDYMIVSNASNPHGFARSLKVNNGNTLVILLPEPSAKLGLSLSTTATYVTIKFYTEVFSSSIYQNYELITEIVKTKAELSDKVEYLSIDFSDKYVSKIEIIPNNINQSQINSINAQIEQLWADAILNNSGEVTTLALSPADQVTYDSLLTQLSRLKENGCITSQCGELDFEVLHTENHYNNSETVDFANSKVVNSRLEYERDYKRITGEAAPYIDFSIHSVIFLYLPEDPDNQFVLHNTLITKISDSTDSVKVCYSSDTPKDRTNKAVIIKVSKINKKPVGIKYTPDCGCDANKEPCIKDYVLCNFLNEITYNLNTCISYTAEDLLNDNWGCFLTLIRDIYNFDKEYPQYGLLQGDSHIKDELDYLESYPGTDNADLYGALHQAEVIFAVMYGLGNCGCSGNNDYITSCFTLFHQAAWVTSADYEYQQTIPGQAAVEEDMQLMQEAMAKVIQPVWRPNSIYCLHVKLKDEVNGDTPHIFDYYIGFKTAGPIGHFDKRNPDYIADDAIAEEYPITSLKSYIDMKKSYPNADGDLLIAKPLFYGHEECEIRFFFTKPYIYNMLKTWEDVQQLKKLKGNINIAIKDPVTDVIIPYPLPADWTEHETVPTGNETWIADNDPNLPLGIQQMINYINHVNQHNDAVFCEINLGDPVVPKSNSYSVVLTNLNPEKLYTVIVYNAFDENEDGAYDPQLDSSNLIDYEENQKIHEFVFKTSRYSSFKEQVESYKLKEYDDKDLLIEEKNAIYQIDLSLSSQQVDDIYTLISGGSENAHLKSLVEKYSEVFDRVFEGILGHRPLDPPNHTEFIKIKNNDEVVAVLVRNPEPFNDPKIPLAEIKECLEINTSGENNHLDFHTLYSKDYSQVLIMHTTKKMKGEKLDFKFQYKVWDGNSYIVRSTVIANEIQINN